jgi:hypothetical protein
MFRIPPALPVQAYRTFEFTRPRTSEFWRRASCAEVDCLHYLHGWATSVLPGSQDEHVVRTSGRHWASVEATPEGFLRFVFPPGQSCFAASRHKVPIEREPIFTSFNGDHRARLDGQRTHTRGSFWVEEFQEHVTTLRDAQERG